jgi:hypothetical protein
MSESDHARPDHEQACEDNQTVDHKPAFFHG